MSEANSGDVNQPTEEAIPPAQRKISDADLRQKPLLVPWTWGDYYAVRYLAGNLRCKLNDVGKLALRRGLKELAAETVADHIKRGKFVPQRLALLACGDFPTVRSGQSEETRGEHR